MALLYHTYLERTSLSAPLKAAGATLVLVGILAQSGGFFLHISLAGPASPPWEPRSRRLAPCSW